MNTKLKHAEKPYNVCLGELQTFFIPHAESNHLNAQDVIHTLVTQAKNLAHVGNLLHDDKEGYNCSDDIIQNLFWDLCTKLEVIDKVLSQAFRYDEHSVE